MNSIKVTMEDMMLRLQNAGIENPRLNSELLLSHILSLSRIDLYLQANKEIYETEKIEEYLRLRIKGTPIQYILEETNFYGLRIVVNKNVLIPRPETELLVERILEENINSVLELGTGSGAISIALSKKIKKIVATDISKKALELAIINAKENRAQIQFIHSDLFKKIESKFDIIVSNPPYISERDFNELPKEVRDFEPKIALLANEEGLYFYRKILENAKEHLTSSGKIYFEIGYDQSKRISKIAQNNGFSKINVFKDLNGYDRIMCISE